jgi:hypothetical protein
MRTSHTPDFGLDWLEYGQSYVASTRESPCEVSSTISPDEASKVKARSSIAIFRSYGESKTLIW